MSAQTERSAALGLADGVAAAAAFDALPAAVRAVIPVAHCLACGGALTHSAAVDGRVPLGVEAGSCWHHDPDSGRLLFWVLRGLGRISSRGQPAAVVPCYFVQYPAFKKTYSELSESLPKGLATFGTATEVLPVTAAEAMTVEQRRQWVLDNIGPENKTLGAPIPPDEMGDLAAKTAVAEERYRQWVDEVGAAWSAAHFNSPRQKARKQRIKEQQAACRSVRAGTDAKEG